MPSSNSQNSDAALMLGILRVVDSDESLTQRSAANELGIALGLVNTYLKRCVKKGYVKIKQAPANRYAYYLTPKGFAEKSRLTAQFLYQSLSLFRQAQNDYAELFDAAVTRGWSTIGLYGTSDLADVVILLAKDYPVTIAGIVGKESESNTYSGLAVVPKVDDLKTVDG